MSMIRRTRSATRGPRSTSSIRGPPATFSSAVGRTSSRPPPASTAPTTSTIGPCGTTKTTNKVPGVVKQEEPEVANKDQIFQTLKLSAQSSSSAVPETQKPAVVVGPTTPKPKPMPARRCDAPSGASEPTQPMYVTGRPVIPPPGNPGTDAGPRQPPTPPPSGVVEPPEPSNDQAKIKFWRDRAIQAAARLVERDRQLQQQGMEILDLSWKAKVAADWTQWWEHHRHEFTPPRPRNVAEPPSPSTERRSRSRSASRSVTRQSNRSATSRRDVRRSVTPTRVDEQVEDRSATWKRKLSRRRRNLKSTCSNPSRTTLNQRVRRPWYHGHPGLTLLSLWK